MTEGLVGRGALRAREARALPEHLDIKMRSTIRVRSLHSATISSEWDCVAQVIGGIIFSVHMKTLGFSSL
jgi:hypothetical protein